MMRHEQEPCHNPNPRLSHISAHKGAVRSNNEIKSFSSSCCCHLDWLRCVGGDMSYVHGAWPDRLLRLSRSRTSDLYGAGCVWRSFSDRQNVRKVHGAGGD